MLPPDSQRSAPKSGEPVYQMLWDCQFCGTQKLLGVDHRFCPNCGARQDPEWRYFPTEEDKKLVTDPKYTYHGADRACPYCKQPNSAAAQFCVACGGDLSSAAEVARRESVIVGSAEDTGKARDLVLERFKAQQAAAKPAKPKSNPLPLILILAAVVGVIGFLIFLSVQRTPAELIVDELQWSRVIAIERLNTLTGSGWHDQVPPGAYNVSCSLRDRPYTVTERVRVDTRRVDRGDGTFIEQPVYESRTRTEYRSERYCNYTYDQWQRVREVRTSGGADDPLVWGAVNLGAREREGGREERLLVFFKRADKPQERRLEYRARTEAEWRSFRVNARYSVNFDGFGNVVWGDLKPQAPR